MKKASDCLCDILGWKALPPSRCLQTWLRGRYLMAQLLTNSQLVFPREREQVWVSESPTFSLASDSFVFPPASKRATSCFLPLPCPVCSPVLHSWALLPCGLGILEWALAKVGALPPPPTPTCPLCVTPMAGMATSPTDLLAAGFPGLQGFAIVWSMYFSEGQDRKQ